jgi:hypothetical protein
MGNGIHDKKKDLAKVIALRMSGAQIDALRSTKGQLKGMVSKDTMYRLRQALDDHRKSKDEARAGDRLAIILGLCHSYINRHGRESDARAQEKVATVEQIQQQAASEMRDWGQRQAEARYVNDASGRGATAFEREGVGSEHAILQTRDLMQKKSDPSNKTAGFSPATLELIATYGLTQAEVLAVKMFTVGNYEHINPATANKPSWMKSQMVPKEKLKDKAAPESDETTEEDFSETEAATLEARLLEAKSNVYWNSEAGQSHLKQLFEEGSLHGALAVKALYKLPPAEGTCYRGARLTEKEFVEKYGVDGEKRPVEKLESLTSVSTVEAVAEGFAQSHKRGDKTVAVYTEVKVKTARDIGDLSLKGRDALHGEGEGEWLLFPGTFLRTTDVTVIRNPDPPPGDPPATKLVFVQAEQV